MSGQWGPAGPLLGEVVGAIPPEDKTFLYYLVISTYVLFVFGCLIFNTIFIVVLVQIRCTTKKQQPFFNLVFQLVIANVIAASCNVIVSIPVVLFLSADDATSYTESVTVAACSALAVLADQLILFANLLISIHRLSVFMVKGLTDVLFEGKGIYLSLALIWILSLAVTFFMTFFDCGFRYEDAEYAETFLFQCTEIERPDHRRTITAILFYEFMGVPLLNLVCYLAIFVNIFYSTRDAGGSLNSRQMSILRQAIALFIIFEASSVVTLIVLASHITPTAAYLVKRLTDSLNLLAGIMVPIVFVSSNKEIRRHFHRIVPITISIGHRSTIHVKSTGNTSSALGGLPMSSTRSAPRSQSTA